MKLHGLSDSVAGVMESPAKCRQCGATTRLGNGLCLSCTLREGLDRDRETSRESFEAALAEDEVHDTHWRVGNYEILEEIGRGGMGVIYRARQRHSRRIVALKRMVSYQADSRETRERFRREAEAAASLDHPNILPIYEVGHGEDGLPFFSMKYAAGGSLQKAGAALRSETRESVRLIAKVARAVQYAHEQGILHRDLKPGNIVLDGRGEPFVTDFGLAKWLDTNTDLTRTLTIFGTPGYIAPEQAKGPTANLAPAADVYSLGAILFDLFTGRPPFLGEHALAVIQQTSEKPAPKLRSLAPTMDRDLETICDRCLEREPQARYRSAGDLADDLERWLEGRPIIARRVSPPTLAWRWSKRNPKLAVATAVAVCFAAAAAFLFFSQNGPLSQPSLASKLPTTRAPIKTMAVLPFKIAGPKNAQDEYLGPGISDSLNTRLSHIKQFAVRPTASVLRFNQPDQNVLEAGHKLAVEEVIDGRIERVDDRVRVTARLWRVSDGVLLWTDTLEEQFTNLLNVEENISRQVAEALQLKLTPQEQQQLSSRNTESHEAFHAYLRGRYAWNKRTNEELKKAAKFFRDAIELDPAYAAAYLGLADSYLLLGDYGAEPPTETFPLARGAALRALEIDDALAEAHASLAQAKFLFDWDWAAAEHEYLRAIELKPNDATAHHWYGMFLAAMGRMEEARREIKLAEELDPLSLIIQANMGTIDYFARQYDRAIEQEQKVLKADPDFVQARRKLAFALEAKGAEQNAVAEWLRVEQQLGADETTLKAYKRACASSGIRGYWQQALEIDRKEVGHEAGALSSYYARLGDREQAFYWLDRAFDQRAPWLVYAKVAPVYDNLRSDPRFNAFLQRMGL
ncbi:MAG: protein kinase domain-containing protein [Chthoniobacterales bacterium]